MSQILHINDHRLAIQSGSDVAFSQGYAWLKDDSVLFDCNSVHPPVKHCRLSPQQINSRYWQQCEQSSIANNAAGMRHAADLIWRHLSELNAKHNLSDVIIVVPAHYQASNLQLLLGIAQSCGIQVTGLVAKPVASVQSLAQSNGHYRHLDVQLHQTVVSHVVVSDGVVKLGEVEAIPSVGIQGMQDALLKSLQESFIQNDRFDPLHYAETEQQLFDQLADVAKQLNASGKAAVTVKYQDRLHRASIDVKRWQTTLAPLLSQLTDLGASSTTDSSAEFNLLDLNSAFNGQLKGDLLDDLAGNTQTINTLPRLDASLASDAQAGEAMVYRTELPARNISAGPAAKPKPTSAAASAQTTAVPSAAPTIEPTGATHLLQAGVAVPIEHAELSLLNNQLTLDTAATGNAQGLLDAGKVFVMNDEGRQRFEPNDRLGSQLADGVVTVIQVV